MADYDTVANRSANTEPPTAVHPSEAAKNHADARGKATAKNEAHKKGLWARFTQRLKGTHCTMTPPECR